MANKVYGAIETAKVFRDSGGDVTIALINLGFGAGRLSARVDRGAGSLPHLHDLRATNQWETAPIVDETADYFLFQSDGTDADGAVGTADAVLTSAQKKNGIFIGSVKAQTTGTATDFTASFRFMITTRYYSIGVWNSSAGDNLENTANANHFSVTPIPPEIQ